MHLQRLIQKEYKLRKNNLEIHIHSQSLSMSVKPRGKTPFGFSHLVGSLTPLMAPVSGYLIKILKVKPKSPCPHFYGSGNCIRLAPCQAQNQASCSCIYPPSHAAQPLTMCWAYHISNQNSVVLITSPMCLHLDLYGLLDEVVLCENDSLVNQQFGQFVKF